MQHILVFNHDLKMYPPILSVIYSLLRLGGSVCFVGYCSDDHITSRLRAAGVDVYQAIENRVDDNAFVKVFKLLLFRRRVNAYLSRVASTKSFVWILGNENSWILHKIVYKYRSILYLFEFPQLSVNTRYRLLAPTVNYRKLMRAAYRVVCSEYNRAHITQAYFGLTRFPEVVPNKPAIPLDGGAEFPTTVWEDDGRKVILYQGIFNWPERRLEELCESAAYLSEQYLILAIGPESEYKKQLKGRYESKDVQFLGFLPPPSHLVITSKASIGFISYFPEPGSIESCLNTLYCAPNKIYEYSRFGIPMIANDVPAIAHLFDKFGAGVCVRDFSPQGIAQAIREIEANYEAFRAGALRLYASVDFDDLIGEIVKSQ